MATAPISDDTLQLLVELCVGDHKSFGDTCKEVRREMGMCTLVTAIAATVRGLQLAVRSGSAACEQALADYERASRTIVARL